MVRRKKVVPHANHERWLVSYADFITLLFAFFVVMFASSQTDKAKVRAISYSVSQALDRGGVQAMVHEVLGGTVDDKGQGNAQMKGPGGSEPRNALAPMQLRDQELIPKLQYLTDALQTEIKSGKLEIRHEERGLVVSMKEAAFFPSGDDTIKPEAYSAIEKIANILRNSANPIRLEGHTDSRPIHTDRFRSNWELSSARGIAMLELLSTRFGIPHERLAVIGYADTVPIASNETEEGRAKNRRVDLVILNQRVAPNAMAAEPPHPSQGSSQRASPHSCGAREKVSTG
ncbi:MAG: flagellar motor protein MotB [Ignavibacteriota bacterium]